MCIRDRYHVLVTLSKVIAPFVPFMAEDIYQNLVISVNPDAPESVHLCDFPVADEALIDEDLNRQMAALREVVSLGLSSRSAANLKVRQPSACLYVKGTEFDEAFRELAEDELNVKNVVFTEDARAFTTYNPVSYTHLQAKNFRAFCRSGLRKPASGYCAFLKRPVLTGAAIPIFFPFFSAKD